MSDTNELTFNDLKKALDIIKGNTECSHEKATRQIGEYTWTCECGNYLFLKATPELMELYHKWSDITNDKQYKIKDIFGIKVIEDNNTNNKN